MTSSPQAATRPSHGVPAGEASSLGCGAAGVSHTSGPWEVARRTVNIRGGTFVPIDAPTHAVAYVPQERDANARLIASAPDLLEALEGLLRTHKGGAQFHKGQCCLEADAAIDAVRKAKGAA